MHQAFFRAVLYLKMAEIVVWQFCRYIVMIWTVDYASNWAIIWIIHKQFIAANISFYL